MTEPPGAVWHCDVCGQEAGRIVRRDGFAFVEIEVGAARFLVAETDGLRCACGAPLEWHYDVRLRNLTEIVNRSRDAEEQARRELDELQAKIRQMARERMGECRG